MRIALAAEGTRGDLYPLLALGDVCRERGFEVVVCAPPNFRAGVEARGMEFRSAGIDVVAYLEEHSSALTRGGIALLRAQKAYVDALLCHAFDALPEAIRGADLLVAAGVQIAAPTAAELHGIPYRYTAYCPALFPSSEHAPATFPTQQLPRWANRLIWKLVFPLTFRAIRGGLDRRRRALGLPAVGDAYGHVLGAHPALLAADPELAPLPPDCPIAAEPIGALQADAEGELPEKLEDFLSSGPPPVYLGFGSMTDPAPDTTTDTLLGALEAVDGRAVVSAGWAGLGARPLPEHVFPLPAVSHARLFPRVAAVVHHGGAGTTTTAARAGVPQIVVPHVMDQYYWAKRVERLGLAPPAVPRRRLSTGALATALAAVLDNEILAERAREVGERLRRADPLRAENREALLERVLAPLR